MVQFDDSFSNKRLSELHTAEAERYVQTMAPQLGFDYVNLQGYTINPAALGVIPEHKAQKAQVAAFELKQRNLQVAAKSPNDPATQKLLQELQTQRYVVSVFMCSTASLEHAWERYKDIKASAEEQKGVMEIDPEKIKEMMDQIKAPEDVQGVLKGIRTANSARRISETMQLVFAGALALGASDVHIEPEDTGIRLRYRFDGMLHDVADLETFMHERLMSRLKLLSGMKLNRSAEAQDGRFSFDIGEKEIEIRSSVIPGAIGESIVMRILDPTVANFSLENIELTPRLREVVMQELKKPNGLILTTGPTGSGKTTILYAFLRETHQEGVKIITIENPVEYKVEGIVQTQIDGEYTFASGLRALLRQDPDIIMVGEIRDKEVAETAIHAAQTGHLVFSTLHTNSAVASFTRLLDLGIDPRALGTSINLILGQRLIRLVCEHCKKKREATPTEVALIKHVVAGHPQPPEIVEPIILSEGEGCQVCGDTGYKGRTGIFEAVQMTPEVEEVVIRDPREHVILEAAAPQQIPTMAEDGIGKVLAGLTTIAELERVIELPQVTATPSANQVVAEETEKATSEEDDFFSQHVV
jgi:type IV pilus assembly protein PilB